MALKKIVNNSGKDICLPWGQWNYEIKQGGELINPPTAVILAMQERYKGIVVEDIIQEEISDEADGAIVSEVKTPIDDPIDEKEIAKDAAEMPIEDIKIKRGRPKKYV